MVSLDDLVGAGRIEPPDLIKIDVEGSEHLVLQGASRTISQYLPHVFLEYLSEFDMNGRVRREVESAVQASPGLILYGHRRRETRLGRNTPESGSRLSRLLIGIPSMSYS
jgi:hypothetical protein